ncbi:hypothetical protein [Erythrobacter sp. NFXS35]
MPVAGIDTNRWGGTGIASPQGSPVPGGVLITFPGARTDQR